MADVAPPTPEAPAAPGKAAKGIRKLPTPVLLAGGGAVLGLAYAFLRDRNSKMDVDATPLADEYAGTVGDQYVAAQVPSGVGYVDSGTVGADSGETVGAVGQVALETLASVFGSVVSRPPIDPDLVTAIAAATRPQPPVATVQTPTPVAKAAATTLPVPSGYSRGTTVYGKAFPGMYAWARIGSGGTGVRHYVDVHIRFTNHVLQRWRYWPNKRPVVWSKVWTGKW